MTEKAFKETNDLLKDELAKQKRLACEWESITRRLYYNAANGGLTEFQKEWYLNEIKEAQGTLTKADNPNNFKSTIKIEDI